MMKMDTRKPVRNLAESLRSLLGVKANLTSSWVDSVCDIIKSLPSEESPTDRIEPANSEATSSFHDQKIDSSTITLKLKGRFFVPYIIYMYISMFILNCFFNFFFLFVFYG